MTQTLPGIVAAVVMAALLLAALHTLKAQSFHRVATALVRMTVQLAVVGLLAYALCLADSLWLGLLWLLLAVAVAAWIMVRRARLRRQYMLLPVGGSLLVGTAVGLLPLMAVAPVWQMAWFVPLSAIILAVEGEVLPLLLREYFVGLVRFRSSYYYKVGNGSGWFRAVMPILRRATDRALLPLCRRMATAGLVGMPLLMGGLMAAGQQPLRAVVLTVVLVLASLMAAAVSVLCVLFLSRRHVIDERGRLIY